MGCQMNEYDSDYLAQSLIHLGFIPVDDPKTADLILINTCTVRAKPENKAFSLLGRMSAIKRGKPGLILGVVGCLAQQHGPNLLKRFPKIDLVMGPREIGRIQEVLKIVEEDRRKVVATQLESLPPRLNHCQGYFNGKVTARISIMEGCNSFCSYCIVPYVRGREVSRSPDDILAEAKCLLSQNVKEITLLGQNVNSYLWEDGNNWSFASLVRELCSLDGLLRLRFTTSHPKHLSDELIQCFGALNILCPHIHLPFQAGSDSVLELMRRGYTQAKYIELIQKLRAVRPDIAITSDVMVGFPGESELDFEMTLDLVKQVQFDGLFSFKYSDRKGTLADKMTNKVKESEKTSRLNTLQYLQKQITLRKNEDLVGKQLEVLVEGEGKKRGQLRGRAGSNKIVHFNSHDKLLGTLVKVDIKHFFLTSLHGERSCK